MSKPRYKAGPKSSKPTQCNLGDSSDESSDKENSQKQVASTESLLAFQTPSVGDATDYNLEYTSNTLPESISTTQSQDSIQRREIRSSRRNARTCTIFTNDNVPSQPQNQSINQDQLRAQSKGRRVKQLVPLSRNQRVLKKIRALPARRKPLIPRLLFSRVIRDIILNESTDITQMTYTAFEAIQEAAEMYVTQRLEDAYLLTVHRGLVTLQLKDLQMMNSLLDKR